MSDADWDDGDMECDTEDSTLMNPAIVDGDIMHLWAS